MSGERRGGRETSHPGEQVFHYDREERLAGREQPTRVTGGIFRRNRGLLIVMLDIVIVLLMFVLYLFLFRESPDSVTIGPYRAEGTAFEFESSVYVTVTISVADAGEAGPAPAGEETLVVAGFPDGARVTDVVPTRTEFPTTLRHVLEGEASEYEPGAFVVVVIYAAGEESALEIAVSE